MEDEPRVLNSLSAYSMFAPSMSSLVSMFGGEQFIKDSRSEAKGRATRQKNRAKRKAKNKSKRK